MDLDYSFYLCACPPACYIIIIMTLTLFNLLASLTTHYNYVQYNSQNFDLVVPVCFSLKADLGGGQQQTIASFRHK